MVEKKQCVIHIKNQDDLCCARAIVTMRKWCNRNEAGNRWSSLRQDRPQLGFLAMELHREAGVPEGTCGYAELEKFQAFLGPQGYQLIVVEVSRCIILFKDPKYNEAPNVIQLVKNQKNYDGLTSIPALMNRSYFCCHCERAYDSEEARRHNCIGQNCSACGRTRKGTEPGCLTMQRC